MTAKRQAKKNQTLRIKHDLMRHDLVNETTATVMMRIDERLQVADEAVAALEQRFADSEQQLMAEDAALQVRSTSNQLRLQALEWAIFRYNRQLEVMDKQMQIATEHEQARQRDKARNDIEHEQARQRDKVRNDMRFRAIEQRLNVQGWVLFIAICGMIVSWIVGCW